MTAPKLPTDWSAQQAFAVLDFLDELYRAIWDHYEDGIVEIIVAQQRAPDGLDSDAARANDGDHDIPF